MYHKKKFFVGIRFKIVIGLLLSFLLGTMGLYVLVHAQIENTIESQISSDFHDIKNNAKVYIKQILILNYVNNDEASFKEVSNEILSELYSVGKRDVALYDLSGNLLCASKIDLFENAKTEEDLNQAKEQKSAFTMRYTKENELHVYFSMPAYVEQNNVGIVRYFVDYSQLYQDTKAMSEMILKFTVVIFSVTLIVVLFLINTFVYPVQKLARISNQVTKELAGNQFNGKHYQELKHMDRRDEVGELNNNYRVMLKTVEEQLQNLQNDKERIFQLMKSRKEFYDNVTHELKTPLTTINGYAQLLESNGLEDRELFDKGIKNIMSESIRLHRMVVQLLEMGEYEKPQTMGPVLVENLVTSVAEIMEVKANRYGNHIKVEVEEGLVIFGQAERIRQVLINLIDNAIKYGYPKEPITVTTKKSGQYVEVDVINRGKGMSKNEMKHIFEPFYRVDKQYSREQGSAGLGLSICEEIMKEHNGKIRVSSEGNQYTTFTLQFPVSSAKERE